MVFPQLQGFTSTSGAVHVVEDGAVVHREAAAAAAVLEEAAAADEVVLPRFSLLGGTR